MIDRYTGALPDRREAVYFVLSTWNLYNVVLMRMVLDAAPQLPSASIAAISSAVSAKPSTSMLAAIRSGVFDFGMTTTSY